VMLPIANRPILSYVVEAIVKNGIKNIVMVVGYKKEQVQDYFGDGEQFGVAITYLTQKQQIGTGHALKIAEKAAADKFIVLPGDNVIEPSTIATIAHATSPTILVRRSENASKYGVVMIEGDRAKRIIEKPPQPESNLVNTGIYVLDRDIFGFLENERDLPVALQRMIDSGRILTAKETTASWLDVVYPWDILTVNSATLDNVTAGNAGTVESNCNIKGQVRIGQGTIVRSNCYLVGPIIIGQGCEIGPNVVISPSTSIGDNVTVSSFSYIKNCVIGSHTQIGPFASIQNSVIGSYCTIGGHFTSRSGASTVCVDNEYHRVNVGTMIGDYCEIEDSVIVQPGVIIGNYNQIRPLKVVTEKTPDRSLLV
ncbi:MAG: sugar phosphate nucleotidyltransferase, partial [Dehalococcoidia bacterium]|nr:sugar phosphate nucleotidyltransferase [Dehalococcoidia bacterium]